ncbi:hypothetical protein ACSSS7_000567 [Eimeria intestinalis]
MQISAALRKQQKGRVRAADELQTLRKTRWRQAKSPYFCTIFTHNTPLFFTGHLDQPSFQIGLKRVLCLSRTRLLAMSDRRKAAAELPSKASRLFFLLVMLVLAPFLLVEGQLRGGEATPQAAAVPPAGAPVAVPQPGQAAHTPYSPMRGGEGAQATGGIPAAANGDGSVQPAQTARQAAGSPGAMRGESQPPAAQAWAPANAVATNPSSNGSLRARQPSNAAPIAGAAAATPQQQLTAPGLAPQQQQQPMQPQQNLRQQTPTQQMQQLQQTQQQQQVPQQQHYQQQQVQPQPGQQQPTQQPTMQQQPQQQNLHPQLRQQQAPQQLPQQRQQNQQQQQQQPHQQLQQQLHQQQNPQQQQHLHHQQQQQYHQQQQEHQHQRPLQHPRNQRGGKWQVAPSISDEDARPVGAGAAGRPTGMDRGAVVLTDETFTSFVKTEPFALVLFYAPWCHWSRATLPEFDAVARFMSKVNSRPIVLGKRDERLDTLPHLDEFMRNGAEGHQLVVAVTTPDNADGSAGGDSAFFDHETFRHVARSFSDEVLFGEIHEPLAFQHFLNMYLLPHSKTTPDMWVPPFIVTMPPDSADPPFVKYSGRGDDLKELERFVHKYRFPQVLAFEPDTIEDIFDDGRSICLLLLDGDRAAKSLTREGLVDPIVAAFHEVAGEFRGDLIFTISGNKEAHERRIFSLMGVDDTITSPVMRIATFNPSGNGKYYPAKKYKPPRPFVTRHADLSAVSSDPTPSPATNTATKATYSFRNRSPTHSLIINALSTSAKAHNSLRSAQRANPHARHGETTFDATQRQEQAEATQIIRDFAKAFLDDKLEPYTNSEPIPPAALNAGPVKTFVGLTFQSEVIDSPHDVFVTFGAPWCGHCRKLEPVFKRVAQIVTKRSSLVMGRIDATVNELEGINLTGYPTLLLYRAGSKQHPIMYDGDRTEADLLTWLARNAQHSKLNLKELSEDLKTLLSGESPKDTRATNASVLEEL